MFGFLKIMEQERLTGRVPEWCEGIEPEQHARWCFDPATVVTIGLGVASTMMQAKNTLAAGKAEQRAGLARQQALEHQAKQARQNAGQERASSQRAASEQRRQARFLSSRALALAAASGGGAGGSVENILGDIGAEGEFRALTEMFTGEERARHLETQADALIFEGNQERRAGDIARRASKGRAFGQVLSGAGKAVGTAYDAGYFSPTTAGSGAGLSRYG